jgi:hypothetical protein
MEHSDPIVIYKLMESSKDIYELGKLNCIWSKKYKENLNEYGTLSTNNYYDLYKKVYIEKKHQTKNYGHGEYHHRQLKYLPRQTTSVRLVASLPDRLNV